MNPASTLDYKTVYREYFATRHKICKSSSYSHEERKHVILLINARMRKILLDFSKNDTGFDPDITFTDPSIWPFGKGQKNTILFQAYIDIESGAIQGYNPVAAQKILGLGPLLITRDQDCLFVSKYQYSRLKENIRSFADDSSRPGKIIRMKDLLFMSADNIEVPANVYLRKVNNRTCKILLSFRFKDCFLYRCLVNEYFNSQPLKNE